MNMWLKEEEHDVEGWWIWFVKGRIWCWNCCWSRCCDWISFVYVLDLCRWNCFGFSSWIFLGMMKLMMNHVPIQFHFLFCFFVFKLEYTHVAFPFKFNQKQSRWRPPHSSEWPCGLWPSQNQRGPMSCKRGQS